MAVAQKANKTPRPQPIEKHAPNARADQDFAIENVVGQFIGCRVAFTWFGSKKGLSEEQRQMAANPFDADGDFIAARKKIIDTKNEKFQVVTNVRTRTRKYWEAITIPYIEPGWRLIKLEHVAAFREQMAQFQVELRESVVELDLEYENLRNEARQSLGSLYDDADYPASLQGQFDVGFDFPAIHPPECLKFLDETAFQEEVDKFREKLDFTVKLTEAAFVEEFTKMITHLREVLSGVNENGKPRVFKDVLVDNLKSFFDRFEVLNLGSNPKFTEVVAMAKAVVGNATADDLRGVSDIRANVAAGFAGIEEELKGMTVDKPKRRIIRTKDAARAEAVAEEIAPDEED